MSGDLLTFTESPLENLLFEKNKQVDPFLVEEEKYQSFPEILAAHNIVLQAIGAKEQELDEQLAQIEKDIKIGSECDKWDYIFASSAGVLAGLVDSFFVGSPTDSKLINQADKAINSLVEKFAKLNGWKGPKGGADSTKSAIGFLERTFKVNYDHQHGKIVNDFMNMTPSNHHLKSLSHSPSPIGLIFSIIDQFRGTATFIDNGSLITVTSESKLEGNTVVAKIFCAFVNWLGHIMSDIAGSSGAKGRGAGVPIPFYELLQTLNIGSFNHKGENLSFADIAVKVFEQGYDFRFGLVQTIPVLMNELFVRFFCIIRHRYEYGRSWKECLVFLKMDKSARLRKMLLVGQGTLCLIDAGDAFLRAKPSFNWVTFFSRINFVAWMRFSYLGLRHAYSILSNEIELHRYKLRAETYDQYVNDVEKIADNFFQEHNTKVQKYFIERRVKLDILLEQIEQEIKNKDYHAATQTVNKIGSNYGFKSKFNDLDEFESFMMED